MARIRAARTRVGFAMILAAGALSIPLTTHAQDASVAPGSVDPATDDPSAMCEVLSVPEVSEALGVAVTVGTSSQTDCSWVTDPMVSDVNLIMRRDIGDLDFDIRPLFEGQDMSVGDAPAYLLTDPPAIFVDLDDDLLLSLELYGSTPDTVDPAAALTTLAGSALPRLADIPLPPEPTEEPEPSAFHDPTLESLMPAMVAGCGLGESVPDAGGGCTVDMESFPGTDMASWLDPEDPAVDGALTALDAALASQGADLDDLRFTIGSFPTEDSFGQILLARATTADLAPLVDAIVAAWFPELADGIRTTSTIAGHEVTRIADRLTSGSPDPSADPFALPSPPIDVVLADDVLWIVYVEDPIAAEVIGLIP